MFNHIVLTWCSWDIDSSIANSVNGDGWAILSLEIGASGATVPRPHHEPRAIKITIHILVRHFLIFIYSIYILLSNDVTLLTEL
jgi:hypothetical protein